MLLFECFCAIIEGIHRLSVQKNCTFIHLIYKYHHRCKLRVSLTNKRSADIRMGYFIAE